MRNQECTGIDENDLVSQVAKAIANVNEHTAVFSYSELMREMAIVAVAICGKGTMPAKKSDDRQV